MKFLFVFISVLLLSCHSKSKQDIELKNLTGWFYVLDSEDGIPILDKSELKRVYIDPEPIITEKNFKSAELSKSEIDPENILELTIMLDKSGGEKISDASKKSIGKKLAFLIAGEPLMIPTLEGVMGTKSMTFILDKKAHSKEDIQAVKKLVKKFSE